MFMQSEPGFGNLENSEKSVHAINLSQCLCGDCVGRWKWVLTLNFYHRAESMIDIRSAATQIARNLPWVEWLTAKYAKYAKNEIEPLMGANYG